MEKRQKEARRAVAVGATQWSGDKWRDSSAIPLSTEVKRDWARHNPYKTAEEFRLQCRRIALGMRRGGYSQFAPLMYKARQILTDDREKWALDYIIKRTAAVCDAIAHLIEKDIKSVDKNPASKLYADLLVFIMEADNWEEDK